MLVQALIQEAELVPADPPPEDEHKLKHVPILHHVVELIDLLLEHAMVVEGALRDLPPPVLPFQLVHPLRAFQPFVVVLRLGHSPTSLGDLSAFYGHPIHQARAQAVTQVVDEERHFQAQGHQVLAQHHFWRENCVRP